MTTVPLGMLACEKFKLKKVGDPELSELVQGLALRSKEPPPDPTAVSVLTVHASKGLEFDSVFLIGLAESVMPSWQSTQKGDASAEMEEERRNCLVAITRTREQLKHPCYLRDYIRLVSFAYLFKYA